MGARHSKRSMDVTTTPKKEGIAEGGEAPVVGDGKLERIEEADNKPTTNGVAPHTDAPEDKDNVKEKDMADKESNKNENETKATEESPADAAAETPAEEEQQVTTPVEDTNTSTTTACSPDTKETKKKEKSKKKWSLRSISFSKKDKNKPVREDAPKNGDVSKEEPLTEGGEEAENAAASPAEEKSVASLNESAAAPDNEVKTEEAASVAVVESKTAEEAPSSPTAPIPTPEEKSEEKTEIVEKVEVSPTQAVAAPIEVMSQPQPIITPSIIERKTSEDFPSLLPSSPPPTPINPSPLQQAQQAAANASALAEALKLPAEDLANACRLEYERSDQDIVNSKPESDQLNTEEMKCPIECDQPIVDSKPIEQKPIETEDVQSIVEDDNLEEDIDMPVEEQVSSDNLKSSPIPVDKEEEMEPIAEQQVSQVDQQQKPSEMTEPIQVIIKTEDNELIADNDEALVENITPENEDDIPPPIPESPIPVPKASSQFMNFIASQIENTPSFVEEIDPVPAEIELQSNDDLIPPPPPPAEMIIENNLIDSQIVTELSAPPPPPDVAAIDKTVPDLMSSNNPEQLAKDIQILPNSPSPEVSHETMEPVKMATNDDSKDLNNHEQLIVEEDSSIGATIDDSNEDADAVTLLENRRSNTIEEKSAINDCLLEQHIQKDDQSIPETEAPAENTLNNSTTESAEETPSPPPAEVPAPVAPAITEDVTSVTKAVEEIDINEKAVAAAVNETIESANKNEIIADMNYQNNLNE